MVTWVRCRLSDKSCAVVNASSGAIAVPVCSPIYALFGHTMSLNSPNTFVSAQPMRSRGSSKLSRDVPDTHLSCISEMVFEYFGVKERSPSSD